MARGASRNGGRGANRTKHRRRGRVAPNARRPAKNGNLPCRSIKNNTIRAGLLGFTRVRPGQRDRQLTGKDVRFYLLGAGLSKDQARRVWEQLDENGNGKVNYTEFASWAQDRLADVAVEDINYTTRSNVNVGQIQKAAAAKIGA